MPRTHNPTGHANPLEFTVEHHRSGGGPVLWTEITHMPSGETLVDRDTYEDHGEGRLFALAWDEEGGNPRDGSMPADDSFIRAALRDIGVALDDEGGAPEPDASGIEGGVPAFTIPDMRQRPAAWPRNVLLALRLGPNEPVNHTAGVIYDDNDDDDVRNAVVAVAMGLLPSVTVGGGAVPECTITRADSAPSNDDAPPAECDTDTALQIAITLCRGFSTSHGPAVPDRLQALLDERQAAPAANSHKATDLPPRLRATWPLLAGAGALTSAQRALAHEAAAEIERLQEAARLLLASTKELLPSNLPHLPHWLNDDDSIPVDMTIGEIRRARAAIAAATR